jgi:hypothetical protein
MLESATRLKLMKFEPDTEMERLLRRHARRSGRLASSGTEAARGTSNDERAAAPIAGGAHLDADEMNAYAEGVLSETARSRYFSHLADCDECRSLVTKLTLAANVATQPSTHAAVASAPSRSWREWLAALFSPPVLRYGVPAFALLLVMVVAFVALRERRRDNLVAQNERTRERVQNSAAAPPGVDERSTQTAAGTTATGNNAGGTLNENANAPGNEQRQADTTTGTAAAEYQAGKKDAEPESKTTAQPAGPKPAQQTASSTDVIQQPRDTDEAVSMAKVQPPVTAPPAAQTSVNNDRRAAEDEARKSGEFGEKAKTARPSTTTAAGGIMRDAPTANNQAPAASRAQRSGTRERLGRSSKAEEGRSREEDVAGSDKRDDGAGETRSAGGRHFRRQGGAWIDTAYNSSRTAINVARGSEQYRALVADEPGIRAIAEQLGGVVVIVWKKRAYRIY